MNDMTVPGPFVGCIPNLPEDVYRADPAIANSDLKYIGRSPAHFYAARLDPDREPEVDTPAKILGRALHCAILEPHTFDQRFYCVEPDAPRDARQHRNAKSPSPETLASIKWWDDYTARNEGKQLVDRAASVKLRKLGARIREHTELQAYLRNGTAEDSIFAIDPVTGLRVKIRTDWRTKVGDLNIVIDLKGCEDARPAAFGRDAWNYGYFQGAAWYCDVHEWSGLGKVDLYLLVALEKSGPGVKIYEVQDEQLDMGRQQYRPAMDLYAHCVKVQEWPAYSLDIEALLPPAWAKV